MRTVKVCCDICNEFSFVNDFEGIFENGQQFYGDKGQVFIASISEEGLIKFLCEPCHDELVENHYN